MASSLPLGVLRAMRPQQWTKNVLVFAAPVAAGVLSPSSDVAGKTVIAFVAFSLAASGTYLLNDVRDIDADRAHPTKRNRPIAAGVVPVPLAIVVGLVLLASSIGVALLANRNLAVTIVAYLGLTITYILWLKFEAILDIVAVAAGFVLRALAGAAAASVPISEWFFIVASFGALLMVTGKRLGELHELGSGAGTRKTLEVYTASFLRYLLAVSSGVVLVAYCLWAFESARNSASSDTSTIWFQLSIVPFVVAILRYAQLVDEGKGGEPETLVLHDRVLQVSGVAWAIIYGYGVYAA
ncbi:MAG: decaprenyl-phosphate phosphoribosyltransferase [Acidimicrobiales bacterium]